ncbi:MAG: hypothetical protein ABI863_04815 [Ginsengibacter sp.]
MLSYKTSLQNSWLNNLPGIPTGRQLARYLQVHQSPVSITQSLNKLIKQPRSITLSARVVTGGLSGLGGQLTLTLNSDGSYTVHFHMWNSSDVTGYDYAVRAIFTSPAGMILVSMHSGHVDAKSITGSSAEDDYEESGSYAVLHQNWSDALNGSMYETHEYSASGGILGELEDIAKEIVVIYTGGLIAGAAGTAMGLTYALTAEAGKAFGGIGETVAIIGGMVVFSVALAAGAGVANSLLLATVAGVAAGAVTSELVKIRPIGEDEYNFANSLGPGGSNYNKQDQVNSSVYMGMLPPMEKLFITNLCSPDNGRAFTVRGADGNIYLNLGAAYDHAIDPAGQGNSYPRRGQLMVHELAHSMQIDRGSTWGVICSGIVNQTEYSFGDDVYTPPAAGTDWHSAAFNNESRAAVIDEWFGRGMSPDDQYFQYIHDNVRTGDMGTVDI